MRFDHCTELCNLHHSQDTEQFYHLSNSLELPFVNSPLLPQSLATDLLCVTIVLPFPGYQINRNIQNVVFSIWPFSFSIRHLRFIDAVMCIDSLFLIIAK